tara:strand:- start:17768 stop:18001 length:234 start_codon:yes stop_codon:yes gene_type:complete
MEKQIHIEINNFFADGKGIHPRIIVLNSKDYKNWKNEIKITHPILFEGKINMKDNLVYRGIRIISSKQISKGEVLVC